MWHNEQSVAVGARVQDEDLGICEAVQRGLKSRAYGAGRLSVRREAGEHLFDACLQRAVLVAEGYVGIDTQAWHL